MQKVARNRMRAIGLSVVVSLLLSIPATAAAEDLAAGDLDLVGVISGFKASFARGPIGEGSSNLGGAGLFAETVLIPHWIEVELSARVLTGHGVAMPIELLFKKPLHIYSGHIFIGAGPTVSLALSGDSSTHVGAASSIGLLRWLNRRVAVIAELNYAALFGHHTAHELGVSTGLAYHL